MTRMLQLAGFIFSVYLGMTVQKHISDRWYANHPIVTGCTEINWYDPRTGEHLTGEGVQATPGQKDCNEVNWYDPQSGEHWVTCEEAIPYR